MRLREFAVATAIAAMLTGLTACTAEVEAAPSAESSPSTTPQESTPSAEAVTRDDPSTWMLEPDRMGPFLLGMPFDAAAVAVPGLESACPLAAWSSFGGPPTEALWLAGVDGRLSAADSSLSDGPRTASGLGVGSTTAEVLEEFPDALIEVRTLQYLRVGNIYFGFRSDVYYDEGDTTYRDEDGVPEEIVAVGVADGAIPYEFCG